VGKLAAGLDGLDLLRPSEKALRELRRRLRPAPLKALFEVVAGPLAQPHTPGVRFAGLRTVAFDGLNSLKVPGTDRNRSWLGKIGHRLSGTSLGSSTTRRPRLVLHGVCGRVLMQCPEREAVMTMPKIDHVATVTGDGSVHVQNLLGGYLGQHFRMTAENFAAWRQMLRTRYGDEVSDPTPGQWCACGLEAGQCRDDKGAIHPAWQPSPLDELYQRCKDIEDADGGWPGSEVVDIVVDILTRHGYEV
jgi:hypothetical protein